MIGSGLNFFAFVVLVISREKKKSLNNNVKMPVSHSSGTK
jgi:hypothetical protein